MITIGEFRFTSTEMYKFCQLQLVSWWQRVSIQLNFLAVHSTIASDTYSGGRHVIWEVGWSGKMLKYLNNNDQEYHKIMKGEYTFQDWR